MVDMGLPEFFQTHILITLADGESVPEKATYRSVPFTASEVVDPELVGPPVNVEIIGAPFLNKYVTMG
jgi:hypothetical protein